MANFDYKLLAALAEVIELQSFELAAQKLFISQSAISQRIKALEEHVGQPVLIRNQPIVATPAGEQLLSHFKKVKQLEHELVPLLSPDQPIKPMKISLAVNADSIATWFIDAITPVLKNHLVELNLIIEHEERTLDKLRSGQAIGAVSTIEKPLKGYRSFKLGEMEYCLVASKAFAKKYFPEGVNQNSLKMAPAISYDHKDDMHVRYIARHFNLAASEYYCHSVRSSEAFIPLAKQGVAYCLIPKLQIEQELIAGQLISLCPGKELVETLYWHSWVLVKGVNKKISEQIVSIGREKLAH
ncbi:ArgP/LysG family DNA-binding transcriptional regulator [Colwellia psychrerythraea]|uniref:Chromosome initiation inhibitor n=1 Tax=Colwellia psychrerythraea (strain 34H / ATCC BAA-681) TaxID=167879 RepID=Q47WN2_COLP3|nr:ArgP/LysG family DNA-binding transcriptional regulator [Colwellia psychrerythraea]AAZ25818.1 chromosome initiation inhibitor [Colwellia psychrerythraea 34H]